jgi:hypothetical protein
MNSRHDRIEGLSQPEHSRGVQENAGVARVKAFPLEGIVLTLGFVIASVMLLVRRQPRTWGSTPGSLAKGSSWSGIRRPHGRWPARASPHPGNAIGSMDLCDPEGGPIGTPLGQGACTSNRGRIRNEGRARPVRDLASQAREPRTR